MNLPFLQTSGTAGTIVGHFDFRNHYPSVNMNHAWSDLSPYIRQAVRSFVLPYVGSTIYGDIIEKMEAGSMDATQTEFAERLKDVCAYYTVMLALPQRKTILAPMGAIENNASEGTTTSSLWGFRTTLWSVAQTADRMMDELLAWMEEQVEAEVSYFVTNWKGTTAYTTVSQGFFRSMADFQKFHNIHRSWRNFRALLPIIEQQAERQILPVLGQDQYDELLDAVTNNDATSAEATLIKKVRKALAKWAIVEASKAMPLLSEQDGFRLISHADAIDQKQYDSVTVQGAIAGMRQSAENAARSYTADLVEFLYTNKTDYPTWEASSANKLNNTDPVPSIYTTGPGAVFL